MSRSALSRGEIVLTRFPFTDLTGFSLRPALVVSAGMIGRDIILAAISSIVRKSLSPTDCVVETTHGEFKQTGLRTSSVIRLHKLVTVEQKVIVRRLGRVGPQLSAEVDKLLRVALGL